VAKRPEHTWHELHRAKLSLGERLADRVAAGMGSWTFIIGQTLFVIIWMGLNVFAYLNQFDPFPFILLNLVFSVQAAYAAPIIMQSQNRQSARDREQADSDYQTNLAAKEEIEQLMKRLIALERHKIDKIMAHLGIAEEEVLAAKPRKGKPRKGKA
jgi:uncharacterized membrane protein